MAAEVAIKITADGKAVVAAAKQSSEALQDVGSQAGKTATNLKETTQSSEGLSAAMRDLDKSATGGGTGINFLAKGATMATTALLAAGAAVGAGFVSKLVEVQRQYDVLNASLVTVTGSSASAAREMAWIKTFAKETPFGLEQAANAFVKMKALGLDPSQKALTSYGNTASAMGKDLSQMIEAVADASTGEFERLKEFGIKAKQNGDQVSLTFQGVTKSIGNNAAEITQYLQAIGEKEFGGAMAERAKTLDGVISGLGDSWDELFRTIGAAGVSGAITNELSGVDNYLTSLVDHMNTAKASGKGMVSELSSGLGYIIARAPFDVLSVSANFLNGTLNLLTGGAAGLNTSVNLLPDAFKTSAQQAVALAQDLKRAEAEFVALKAQSDKQGSNIYFKSELAALALYIGKLKEAQAQKAALTGTGADPRESNPSMTRGASYARWDQEQVDAAKALTEERMKAAGVNKDYFASLKTYQTGLRSGLMTEKEYVAAVSDLAKKTWDGSTAGKDAAKTAREGATANKAGASAAKSAADEYQGLLLRVNERISLADEEIKAGRLLSETEKQEVKLTELLDSAKSKLNSTQRSAIEHALGEVKAKEQLVQQQRANLTAGKDLAAAEARRVQALEVGLAGMAAQNKTLAEEIELMGLSEVAQLAITQARLSSTIAIKEEQLARLQNTQFMGNEQIALEEEIRLLKERQSLQGQRGSKNIAVAQAKEAETAWKAFYADLERGLTDSLFRAFESGKGFFSTLWSGIKNLFKTTALKLIINPVSSAITGALGLSGAGNAATSGGGLLGSLSNVSSANSLYGLATTGYAGALGSAVSTVLGTTAGNAAIATAITGSSSSAAAAALAASQAAGTATAASATLASVGSSIAVAMPYLAAALAAVAVVSSMLSKPDSRYGGTYADNFTGSGAQYIHGPEQGSTGEQGVRDAINATVSGINGLFQTMGSQASLTAYHAGLETSNKGRGGVMAGGRLSNGTAFGESGTGSNYDGTYYESTSSQSPDSAAAAAAFATDLKQSMIQALQAAGDLPASIAKLLQGVNAEALSDEAVTQLLNVINGQVAGVALFREAMKTLPFKNLKDLSFDATAGLAAAAGGFEALSANLSGYYDNFYTDEEKRLKTIKDINAAIAGSGLDAATATRDSYRRLMEAQDVTTEAGRKMYAALLNASGAFASISSAVDTVASARGDLIESYKAEASAMQSTVERFGAFATSLRGFRDGLLTGSLSPLTPAQRYAEASREFDRLTTASRTGTPEDRAAAMAGLQSAASALLEASRVYNASGSGYVMDFDRVREALAAAATSAAATADVAQLQLDAVKAQLTALGQIDKSVLSVSAAIAALAAAQQAAGTAKSLPGFAVGTNYVPQDMVAVIHQGEAIVPRAYNPAAGGQVANFNVLIQVFQDEIRGLKQEIAQLRRQQDAEAGAQRHATYDAAAKNADTVTAEKSKAIFNREPALS